MAGSVVVVVVGAGAGVLVHGHSGMPLGLMSIVELFVQINRPMPVVVLVLVLVHGHSGMPLGPISIKLSFSLE